MCTDPGRTILHATAVEIGAKGVLILGPSGSGKSSLALTLMAFGARLICDDRVELCREDAALMLHAVDSIAGKVEARGFGLLAADHQGSAPCALVVDLSTAPKTRLPETVMAPVCGVELPYLAAKDTMNAAAVVVQFLKSGLVT